MELGLEVPSLIKSAILGLSASDFLTSKVERTTICILIRFRPAAALRRPALWSEQSSSVLFSAVTTSPPCVKSIFILVVLALIPPSGSQGRASLRLTEGLCGAAVIKGQGGWCDTAFDWGVLWLHFYAWEPVLGQGKSTSSFIFRAKSNGAWNLLSISKCQSSSDGPWHMRKLWKPADYCKQ